jgi:hypothetical protein
VGTPARRTATPRLRVADAVLRAFEYACVMQDARTAHMLLMVLEDMGQRKLCRFGGDRRRAGIDLAAAHERLRRLQAPGPATARPLASHAAP